MIYIYIASRCFLPCFDAVVAATRSFRNEFSKVSEGFLGSWVPREKKQLGRFILTWESVEKIRQTGVFFRVIYHEQTKVYKLSGFCQLPNHWFAAEN